MGFADMLDEFKSPTWNFRFGSLIFNENGQPPLSNGLVQVPHQVLLGEGFYYTKELPN